MKQFVILCVLFLSLMPIASLVYANSDDLIKANYSKAKKDFARARVLVAGAKGGRALKQSVYAKSIAKAEILVDSADDNLSKAREALLKTFHNGEMNEATVADYKQQLKIQRDDIANLRSIINDLHDKYTKKTITTTKGVKRAVAVTDFLEWLDYVKQLKETEGTKWTRFDATKDLWNKAASYSGFYGIHINNLADSVSYADDRDQITQRDHNYIKNGVKRFIDFHKQFTAQLTKINAAHNVGLEDRQRWGEVSIRPYLSQKVFSGLPTQTKIPELPRNPADNFGYIPSQSMMQTFSDLPKNPSLSWIKRDEKVMQVLRALYNRGLAHEFLKKFVNLGGSFTVDIADEISKGKVYYFQFDGTLFLPKNAFNNGKLNINPKLLSGLLRELFQAYCDKVIDAKEDPLTKNLLVNIEMWLGEQFIRRDNSSGGSGAWVGFKSKITDSKYFTEDYVARIIDTSFTAHLKIWNKLHYLRRDARVSVKKADIDWALGQGAIINAVYLANQDDDIDWEVQTVPPAFVINYINAFFELGDF